MLLSKLNKMVIKEYIENHLYDDDDYFFMYSNGDMFHVFWLSNKCYVQKIKVHGKKLYSKLVYKRGDYIDDSIFTRDYLGTRSNPVKIPKTKIKEIKKTISRFDDEETRKDIYSHAKNVFINFK